MLSLYARCWYLSFQYFLKDTMMTRYQIIAALPNQLPTSISFTDDISKGSSSTGCKLIKWIEPEIGFKESFDYQQCDTLPFFATPLPIRTQKFGLAYMYYNWSCHFVKANALFKNPYYWQYHTNFLAALVQPKMYSDAMTVDYNNIWTKTCF